MKKIPTLFIRDEDWKVTRSVAPGCEWVLAGEGVATRKYDGACCMFDGERWWSRRMVREGRIAPAGFIAEDVDPATRITFGWEPIGQSPFLKFHREAVAHAPEGHEVGTYELIGPRINGNPEVVGEHMLVNHANAARVHFPERTYDSIRETLTERVSFMEGVVFHHDDGRMAKIKTFDFA